MCRVFVICHPVRDTPTKLVFVSKPSCRHASGYTSQCRVPPQCTTRYLYVFQRATDCVVIVHYPPDTVELEVFEKIEASAGVQVTRSLIFDQIRHESFEAWARGSENIANPSL